MALPPEASEALDDSTSPERLTEIAETFPELQSLVAVNPSCPERTREWILASNRSAAELYRTTQHGAQAASGDPAAVAEQAHVGGDAWGLGADRDDGDQPSSDVAGPAQAELVGEAEPETEPVDPVDAEATQAMSTVDDEPTTATAIAEHVVPLSGESSRESAAPVPSASREPDERPSLPRVSGYLDAISPAPAEHSADPSPSPAPFVSPAVHGSPGSSASPLRPAVSAAGAASPAGYASPTAYGSPPQPPAGGAGRPSQPGGGAGKRTLLWAALGCLALAIVLVVVIGIGAYLVRGGGEGAPAATSTTSASESPTESPSESESPSASTSASLVSPAPDDAQDLTSVHSPTGNITCELGDDSVGCSIGTWSFPPSGNCTDTSSPFSIAVAGDRPTVDCGSSYGTPGAGSGTELPYGSSAANGEVACRSESSGMTCWNQRTGHGFTLSKASSETF